MKKLWQLLANLVLYAFLVWLLYEFTIKEKDYWLAFVVAFVLVLAAVVSMIPSLHASRVSPREYPYDD